MTTFVYPDHQLPPTPQESAVARASVQRLSPYANRNQPLSLRLMEAGHDRPLELPAGAVVFLVKILGAMAAGHGLSLIPENADLTTVKAAEILNVSRPFLIKLLTKGAIPHHKVGKHRRVRVEDVLAYKANIDREREAVLDELASDAQKGNMGYPRP